MWKTHKMSSFLSVLCVSIGLKLLLLPSYTSTDFEVHRNWLAITHTLPREQWYHDTTSIWTLDYPPLFATFEYILSILAYKIDPNITTLSSTPIFTSSTLYFQRSSVIIADFILYFAIYQYIQACSWIANSQQKQIAFIICICMDAGLLIVDHIHFQYNGMLLGLFLLSITKIQSQKYLYGAFYYTILLLMKHIYLYVAPLYFIYILAAYCIQETRSGYRFSIVNLIKVGCLVLSIVGLTLGILLWNHPDPMDGIISLLRRLFPVQRGLCHAYWAPNIWALYAFADKVFTHVLGKQGMGNMSRGLVQETTFVVLPNISPLVCSVLTLFSMIPVLWYVWRSPRRRPQTFLRAISLCMMSSFMFGYHVHEKAILQVILPLGCLAMESLEDLRLYQVASIISTLSLFPLLFTPAENGTKWFLFIIHALFVQTVLVSMVMDGKLKNKSNNLSQSRYPSHVDVLIIIMVLFATVFATLVSVIAVKYEFLPLLIISISCALGNVCVWGKGLLLFFKS